MIGNVQECTQTINPQTFDAGSSANANAMTMNALNSLSQFSNLGALNSPHGMQAAMNALAASTAAAAAANQSASSGKNKDYIPTGILR